MISLTASDSGLRRVSVHAGGTATDLALPAGVPVAVLIPSVVDVLGAHGSDDSGEARRLQLTRPGTAPLSASATLAQNGIRDGDVLILTQGATPPPAPRHDDVAVAVSAKLGGAPRPGAPARRRQTARLTGAIAAACLTGIGAVALVRDAFSAGVTDVAVGVVASAGLLALLGAAVAHRTYGDATAGLALGAIAAAFAALAGFLAVPGPPGPPNLALAAAAAAVISVLGMRVSGCGAVTLTALACVAGVIAGTAVVGVITAAPSRALGAVSALISVGLLGLAARLSLALARLSPQLPPPADLDQRAIRAHHWFTSLRAAFASTAAVGAVVAVLAGAGRPSCIAFGAATGAWLLLRVRSQGDPTPVLAASGMVTVTTAFGVVALNLRGHGAWVAATMATLVATAVGLGFVAAATSLSPALARGVEALERALLIAMVPTACWVCGLYGAVRGLTLP